MPETWPRWQRWLPSAMLLAPGVGAAVVLFVSAMRQGVQQPIVIALVIACALQVYFVFLPAVRREVRFTLLGLALRLCAANAVGWGVAWLLWPSGQPGLVSALMRYVGPPVWMTMYVWIMQRAIGGRTGTGAGTSTAISNTADFIDMPRR